MTSNEPLAVGGNLDASPDLCIDERASEWDREWFAQHPDRSFRARRARPKELANDQAFTHCLVHQVRPGVRVRRGIQVWGEGVEDSDAAIADVFDAIGQGNVVQLYEGRLAETWQRPGNISNWLRECLQRF